MNDVPDQSQVRFPLVLIDDDQLLEVCETDQELQLEVESVFFEDVEIAFDALARPVELSLHEVRGRWGRRTDVVVARVGGPADPEELRRRTERFFRLWTYGEAPEFSGDPGRYIAEVAIVRRAVKERRRPRRD